MLNQLNYIQLSFIFSSNILIALLESFCKIDTINLESSFIKLFEILNIPVINSLNRFCIN